MKLISILALLSAFLLSSCQRADQEAEVGETTSESGEEHAAGPTDMDQLISEASRSIIANFKHNKVRNIIVLVESGDKYMTSVTQLQGETKKQWDKDLTAEQFNGMFKSLEGNSAIMATKLPEDSIPADMATHKLITVIDREGEASALYASPHEDIPAEMKSWLDQLLVLTKEAP